jgi:CspA family cold shock protein
MMINGTVKWFNDQKGYGFVESSGKDYFIHFKEINMSGFKSLKEGDKVCFEPTQSSKGPMATKLILDE